MIHNQRGNITMLGTLICLLVGSTFALMVIKKIDFHYSLRKMLNDYNCIKKYNGITSDYIAFMEKTNWSISNIDKLDTIFTFFPHFRIAKLTTKGILTALKRSQDVYTISYMQKLHKLKSKSCSLPLTFNIAPYNNLKRKKNGTAPIRKKKWDVIFIGEVKIKETLQVKSRKLSIKSFQIL